MTVRQLLGVMDSAELTEWVAYYGLEPWGEERADIRSAIVASTIANVWGGRTKIKDFVPRFERPEPQPWQQVKGFFQALAMKGQHVEQHRQGVPDPDCR